MNNFTIRVELHGASEDNYELLHAEMAKFSFLRTIKSDDGKIYKLPPAEYNLQNSNFTKEEVIAKAREAATKTKLKHAVLVSECIARTWVGLELEEATAYKPKFNFFK